MKTAKSILALMALYFSLNGCQAQPSFGEEKLKLEKTILLPGVKGRIDHLDINLESRIVYVAALGNNTVEAVNLETGKVVHSITGMDEPQGVGYIPQHNELFIANGGSGDCYFYNASTYEKVSTVHLSSDADDVRYDSVERKIYVGYGSGGIAVIDADSRRQTADVQLPAHPEGFQLDKELNRLYVNLPDAHIVGVVDLKEMKLVEKWSNKGLSENFPMTVDAASHQLFIGYRDPTTMTVLDGRSGKLQASENIVGDTDDLYYYAAKHRLYVSGGDGAADVFEKKSGGYSRVAHVSTRSGARTSLLIPQLQIWVVAARATGGNDAALMIYNISQ